MKNIFLKNTHKKEREKNVEMNKTLYDVPSTNSYWGYSIYYNVVIDGNITNIINSTAKAGIKYLYPL